MTKVHPSPPSSPLSGSVPSSSYSSLHHPSPAQHHHHHNNNNGNGSAQLYRMFMIIFLFSIVTFFATTFFVSDHHHPIHNHNDHQKHNLVEGTKHALLEEFVSSSSSGGGSRGGKSSSQQSKQSLRRQSAAATKTTTTTIITTTGKDDETKKVAPASVGVSSSSSSSLQQTNMNNRPHYHIVFSTSCSDQQNWESYVFFYHAYKVQQPGDVTRIVSGCNDVEGKALQEFHNQHIQTLSTNFYLHMTPDFSKRPRGDEIDIKSKNYKYMNKPYGLRHWMESSLLQTNNTTRNRDEVDHGIIILMDPDMILLRPIVHDYTNEHVIFVDETNPNINKVVQHGNPIAQQDGYLANQWMYLNQTYITNGKSLPSHIQTKDGPLHYNTGPPYLATVRDMYEIAKLWTYYAPRVHDIHPVLFAEMYAFIIATTQLNLPHTLIKSLVVSTTETKNREGWAYVDALDKSQVCGPRPDTVDLPIGLHYCKRYLLGRWFFSKYRLKKKFISCETPLLTEPPPNLAEQEIDYWEQPPPHGHRGLWEPPSKNITERQAKREAFMVCGLISAVNEAARHYKQTACHGTANMTTFDFFSDPDH